MSEGRASEFKRNGQVTRLPHMSAGAFYVERLFQGNPFAGTIILHDPFRGSEFLTAGQQQSPQHVYSLEFLEVEAFRC